MYGLQPIVLEEWYIALTHLLGNGEAGGILRDGVGVSVDRSAGTLADGSDDLVESRVERVILVGSGLELHRDGVETGALLLDGVGGSEGVAVLSRRVDLHDDLTSSRSVRDAVSHIDREGGSLGSRGGRNRERSDGSLSVLRRGAHIQSHAYCNRIRVQLVDDVGELRIGVHVVAVAVKLLKWDSI